jgi:hypothetical protein
MSDVGMNSDVDIGTLPISEWRFSVQHICLRYRNNRCRCRISPTLRSMSMPTYVSNAHKKPLSTKRPKTQNNPSQIDHFLCALLIYFHSLLCPNFQVYTGARRLEEKFPSKSRKWCIISPYSWANLPSRVTCSHKHSEICQVSRTVYMQGVIFIIFQSIVCSKTS